MIPERFEAEALQEAIERSSGVRGQVGLNLLTWLSSGAGGPIQVAAASGVGTARLRQGTEGPVIEVDPEFLREYVLEPASALHLLGHELLHHVRGDLTRFAMLDQANRMLLGLALDMFVDAHLERVWFGGEGAPYLRRLYKPNAFPELLLLPPRLLLRAIGDPTYQLVPPLNRWWRNGHSQPPELQRWETRLAEWLRPLGVQSAPAVAHLYFQVWFDRLGFAEFWALFRDVIVEEMPLLFGSMPLLLGDHSPARRDALPAEWQRELQQQVDALLTKTGGYGRDLKMEDLQLPEEEPDPGPVLMAVQRALDSDPDNPVVRRRLDLERGVMGGVGRAEALSLAVGHVPVFWTAQQEQDQEDDERVQLYIDASGSMDEVLPFLFRLVSTLGEHVGQRVFLFSNQVVATDLEDIRRGRYETTYGTDFDCVVDHALARRYRRFLVVTDGYASLDPGLASRAAAEDLRCYVVLVGDGIKEDNPLSRLAKETWIYELPGSSIPF